MREVEFHFETPPLLLYNEFLFLYRLSVYICKVSCDGRSTGGLRGTPPVP